MNKNELEVFLDNGWYNEAALFYNGYIYWCEGYWNGNGDEDMHFFVYRFLADTYDGVYVAKTDDNDALCGFDYVFKASGKNEAEVKEEFLKAKVFEGKTFWEIEKEIEWCDE